MTKTSFAAVEEARKIHRHEALPGFTRLKCEGKKMLMDNGIPGVLIGALNPVALRGAKQPGSERNVRL
jgi:hypothetical protein